MSYRQTTLKTLVRNDKAARFQTRGQSNRFWGKETTIFLNDEIASSGVDDSYKGLKDRRKLLKWQVGSTSWSEA
jgi:hypothetical protein